MTKNEVWGKKRLYIIYSLLIYILQLVRVKLCAAQLTPIIYLLDRFWAPLVQVLSGSELET